MSQDHRGSLQSLEPRGSTTHKLRGCMVGDVAHVIRPGRDIPVLHSGEYRCVLLANGQHRRRALQTTDALLDLGVKFGLPGNLDVSLEDARLFLVAQFPEPVAGLRKPPDHNLDRSSSASTASSGIFSRSGSSPSTT